MTHISVWLPSATLRISGDQLAVRAGSSSEFTPRGSASGVHLDVGRELLMHPFLLRTTKKSIRDIGKEVGYKDTAYFCRRFKMMFGIPAGKMRRRESAMNI